MQQCWGVMQEHFQCQHGAVLSEVLSKFCLLFRFCSVTVQMRCLAAGALTLRWARRATTCNRG